MGRRRPPRAASLVGDDLVAPVEAPPIAWPEVAAQLAPELWLAAVAIGVALQLPIVGPELHGSLMLVPVGELMFCMAQATLTDIATRLRKRPPLWLVPLILGGVLVVYGDALQFLRLAWSLGWPVFLPWALSVLERGRELWTLPRASRLDKLRRRALVAGRMTLVLGGGAVAVVLLVVGYFVDEAGEPGWLLARVAPWGLAAAFLVAAWDVVRVHLPAFARRPRSLLPFFDPMHVQHLDPL